MRLCYNRINSQTIHWHNDKQRKKRAVIIGFIRGLSAINNVLDERQARSENAANYQKVEWLKLNDGQSVKVRFVEELEEDSAGYDESRGLAVVISEHSSPEDFRRKAQCTQESEGRCFACEQARLGKQTGWWSKLRYYANVVVDDGTGQPQIQVWSQGVSTRSAFNIIREYAMDMGAITNLVWKLKRNGMGTETNYLLMPQGNDAEPFDWSGFEFFNLEKIVREVPYAEQEAFYLGLEEEGNLAKEPQEANISW